MERTPIDTLDAFDAMRPEWDDLRRADPYATVFQTSAWVRAFITSTDVRWTILTLRDAGRLVAALPIAIRYAPHRALPIARELTFASAPFADYQGMLCEPEREAEAIQAFAEMILGLGWERAEFSDVRDPRVAAIAARLAERGTALRQSAPAPCSVIDLPADWETFLARLSKPTRRRTLRPLKHIAASLPNWRLSEATEADVERHIDAALLVNELRWGSTSDRREKFRRLFRATFAEGCLGLTVLWDGDHPFAAAVTFLDRERSVYGAYMINHDPKYAKYGAGKAMLAHHIRLAIEQGFRTFDFMRGGEAYKSSYASRETLNMQYTLTRPGVRAAILSVVQPGYAAIRDAFVRLRLRPHAA